MIIVVQVWVCAAVNWMDFHVNNITTAFGINLYLKMGMSRDLDNRLTEFNVILV
jgi:hypothetical protein